MKNEIDEYAKFLTLQEQIKLIPTEDEDDDDDVPLPDVIPVDKSNLPSGDVLKRKLQASAPKPTRSNLDFKPSMFAGAQSNPAMNALYMGKSISASTSPGPMIPPSSLKRMPIAASYEPFKNINDEMLNENMLKMKRKINALLNKEPHKTVVNNMRKELEM